MDTSTSGTQWGTGGMATKLTAARIATAAGCKMAICSSADPRVILRIIAGERVGTVFHPISTPLRCAGWTGEYCGLHLIPAICLIPGLSACCQRACLPMDHSCLYFSPAFLYGSWVLQGAVASCRWSVQRRPGTPVNIALPAGRRGRKRWILSVPVKGELWLDEGAVRAVKDRHTSLFSAGITKVRWRGFVCQVGGLTKVTRLRGGGHDDEGV